MKQNQKVKQNHNSKKEEERKKKGGGGKALAVEGGTYAEVRFAW